jgi:hypothetical protein
VRGDARPKSLPIAPTTRFPAGEVCVLGGGRDLPEELRDSVAISRGATAFGEHRAPRGRGGGAALPQRAGSAGMGKQAGLA